jgi:hypothetical protein
VNHKAHFKGGIQVDGDIVDKQGASLVSSGGGALTVGDPSYPDPAATGQVNGTDRFDVGDKPVMVYIYCGGLAMTLAMSESSDVGYGNIFAVGNGGPTRDIVSFFVPAGGRYWVGVEGGFANYTAIEIPIG